MRNPKTKGGRLIRRLKLNIRRNKKTFILYSVLRVLVILAMIRSLLIGNYEGVMLCLLSLALFLLPSFVMQRFRVQIPPLFEGLIYIFIFASEILGELDHYFVRVPGWDTMLHTVNGFLCAAVGFSLVYLLNRHSRDIRLSPLYLALVAFCFSMTIGVLWEFFECAMDQFFREDMQKEFILRAFTSVTLDPDGVGNKVRVADITRTVIQTASGRDYVIEGGYLDVGLLDTMKDLFVNFIGAAVFSVIGYFYALRGDDRSKRRSIARDLMLTPKDDGQ